MKIGEIVSRNNEIELNPGFHTVTIAVTNMGDRPIQVGSHYHFFEANKYLKFDRKAAYGFRLDIASGTSVRFEPGEEKEVQLVALGGKRRVFGLNDLTRSQVSEATITSSLENARKRGFMQEEGH
ncbi:MAG: urease subunit beta [bacterium]|nr:urease subunit beta [bacterium]